MLIKKFISSFSALNITQFLTALNDNIYKLLLVFLLISTQGKEHSNTILSLAGAIFVIPFLLFAPLAGTLADRFSKQRIILLSRFYEIIVISLALLFFYFKNAFGGYFVLFMMAFLSTIFSPCKYGILPEIVKREKLSHYNGILTATTYLAMILGTFFASFLADITEKNYLLSVSVCLFFALLSLVSSFAIEKTEAQAKEKKVPLKYFSVILSSFKNARKIRYLLISIIFGAYFLFMGAYIQLNIIPFTLQSLNLSEIVGGYLFLLTAIGIGIGSFLAGRFSGKEIELAFVPLAAFCISLVFFSLYFFQYHFIVIAPLLILIGFFGGFYIIPIDAYIQAASPKEDRGQNVASANFLSFVGVLIASLLLALFGNLLDFSAAEGFLVLGILTAIVFFALLFLMTDQLFRFFIARVIAPFWPLKVFGRRLLRIDPPHLIVAPRLTFADTLLVMATLPRMIRYIIPLESHLKRRKLLLRFLRLIPIDIEHLTPIGEDAIYQIEKELKLGHSVCLMLPSDLPITHLEDWREKLTKIQKNFSTSLIAIAISKKPSQEKKRSEFFSLFKTPTTLVYRKL